MGLLLIEFVIDIRCFVYLHHILLITNDVPVKSLFSAVKVTIEKTRANKIHTSSSKTIQHHSQGRIFFDWDSLHARL